MTRAQRIAPTSTAHQGKAMRIPFRFETARTIQILGDVAAADSRQPAAPSDREVQPEKHTCGNCHACCINLPIPAGEVSMNIKPPGVRCPHLAENGCQVYSSRPQMCSQFSCTWLAESSWPEAWRPEQSGLLCLQEDIDNGVSAALVYEIAPKALERPSAPVDSGKAR